MNEITKINFQDGREKAYASGFTQYDQGCKLEIGGLDISSEIVEVHFSFEEYGSAKRMLGIVNNGIISVDIPPFILEGPDTCSDYNAYAWIYLTNESHAETEREIVLRFKGRARPDEYVSEEDLDFLQQLENYINGKLDKTGHAPNMYLGTDEEGNIITKEGSSISGEGKDGASAYEIAVANGFDGSEEEWLESLKGEQGEDGDVGKSAYQYAQDGGYTGTEEEFSTKLAQDIALTHDGNGNVTISGVAVFVDGNEVEY
jgi:hypothetical protein